MNGTLVNMFGIMAGSLIGIGLKTGFFKEKSEVIISALGLMVLVIGIKGVLASSDFVLIIVSLALGLVIGEAFDLDRKFNRFVIRIEQKFIKNHDGRFSQGLISASLLFGVGAMAIVGSLESGLYHNETILYTKTTIDFVTSIVLASSFGWGVFFSFIPITLYQGSLTLLSQLISVYLNDALITNISAIGSVMIMALGFNMMKTTNFKVINMLPSLFIIIILQFALSFI